MYYDIEGPVRSQNAAPPPYRIDFVTGDEASGSVSGAEALPLSLLYFCDGCSRVVSRRDLAEDVDSYYCSNCLENMPSSEAMYYGMRCSKCWECPVCASTLVMCTASIGGGGNEQQQQQQSYHLACSCCRWNSRGRLEALQPEQLVARCSALERENETKQHMAGLVDAFKGRAQEQHREREFAARLKRRSTMNLTRSSWNAASMGGLGRYNHHAAHHSPTSGHRGSRLSSTGGQAKFRDEVVKPVDLRTAARMAAAAGEGSAVGDTGTPASVATPMSAAQAARLSLSTSPILGTSGGGGQGVPEVPVLEGLTLQQLLEAHTETGSEATTLPLLDRMARSVEEDATGGGFHLSSMAQRLQQISYGYQQSSSTTRTARKPAQDIVTEDGGLRVGRAQLEAPLQHLEVWALLPVRKPLLTKRARRCRLLVKTAGGKDEAAGATGQKVCRQLVVKPQINPCSNPPFQKNNVAVAFIPRCVPWAWRGESGTFEGGVAQTALPATSGKALAERRGPRPRLKAKEEAELIFTMANPLDTEIDIELDPCGLESAEGTSLGELVKEQNVTVLTERFTTTIMKFNDLADLTDTISGDDALQLKALKEKDNTDVIPDRRMHKILIRLRFKAAWEEAESLPWAFFAALTLSFTDASGNRHQVRTILRFGTEEAQGKKR